MEAAEAAEEGEASTQEVTVEVAGEPTATTTTTTTETTEVEKPTEKTNGHANGDINKNTETQKLEGIACSLAPADSYIAYERSQPVKIRFSGDAESITGRPAISVMEFFENRYDLLSIF